MGDIRIRFSDRRHDRITLSRLRGSRLGAVRGLDRGINDGSGSGDKMYLIGSKV
jgi:hypothetical protein